MLASNFSRHHQTEEIILPLLSRCTISTRDESYFKTGLCYRSNFSFLFHSVPNSNLKTFPSVSPFTIGTPAETPTDLLIRFNILSFESENVLIEMLS